MTANRQLAALRALDSAVPYMLLEDTLFADVNIRLSASLSYTEFRRLLTNLEQSRRAVCVDTEDGRKWKITDDGKARLAELA